MKLCNECWRQVDYDWEISEFKQCCGDIVDIDDVMVLPLQMLHRKGYITLFSCSGHICIGEYVKAPYIMISIPLTYGHSDKIMSMFETKSFSKLNSEDIEVILKEYVDTNLGDVINYFRSCNVDDKDDEFLTYNEVHNGLRMTIRHPDIPCIRNIGNELEDYESWLSCNQDFAKIIANAPDVRVG